MTSDWVVDNWINELALSPRRQERRGGPGPPKPPEPGPPKRPERRTPKPAERAWPCEEGRTRFDKRRTSATISEQLEPRTIGH